jgi:hypothetical protein
MQEQPSQWSKQNIHMLLHQNNFWVKPASEGRFSLMQALSNALYFTGAHHASLQQKVCDFFQRNVDKIHSDWKGLELLDSEEFLENPNDAKFDELNLQLFGMWSNSKVKVYWLSDEIVSCRVHNVRGEKTQKILNIGDNCYAAIFKKSQKPIFTFMQNIVLGFIDKSLRRSKQNLNFKKPKKFINFDFEHWKSKSGVRRKADAKSSGAASKLAFLDSLSQSSDPRSYSLTLSEEQSEFSDNAIRVPDYFMPSFNNPKEGPVRIRSIIEDRSEDSRGLKMKFYPDISKTIGHHDVNRTFIIVPDEYDKEFKICQSKLDEFKTAVKDQDVNLATPVSMARIESFFSDDQGHGHQSNAETRSKRDLGFDIFALSPLNKKSQIIKTKIKTSMSKNEKPIPKEFGSIPENTLTEPIALNLLQANSSNLLAGPSCRNTDLKDLDAPDRRWSKDGASRIPPDSQQRELAFSANDILQSSDAMPTNQETSTNLKNKKPLSTNPENLQPQNPDVTRAEPKSVNRLQSHSPDSSRQKVIEGDLLHIDFKSHLAIIRPKSSFSIKTIQLEPSSVDKFQLEIRDLLEKQIPVCIALAPESPHHESAWKITSLNCRHPK